MRILLMTSFVVVGLSASTLAACDGETVDRASDGPSSAPDGGAADASTCTTTDEAYRACTTDADCTVTEVADCSCRFSTTVVGVARSQKTVYDRCSKEAFDREMADSGLQCGGCMSSDKCTVDDGTTMGCAPGSDNIEAKCMAGRCTSSFKPPADAAGG